jgi:cell division protein FtsI/penicillin-binding protein 2
VVHHDLHRGTSIGYRVSVTALQMAMVYAAVANDGVWVQPHFVAETVAGDGTRVTFEAAERRVLSPATAAQMRSMLEAVVQVGTGTAGAVTGSRVGGKTGTTEKYLESEQAYATTRWSRRSSAWPPSATRAWWSPWFSTRRSRMPPVDGVPPRSLPR